MTFRWRKQLEFQLTKQKSIQTVNKSYCFPLPTALLVTQGAAANPSSHLAEEAGLHSGRVASLSATKHTISKLGLFGVKRAILPPILIQIASDSHMRHALSDITRWVNHFLFEQPEDLIHKDTYPCYSTSQCSQDPPPTTPKPHLHPTTIRFKISTNPKSVPSTQEINHIYCVNMITHNLTSGFPYHDEASQSPAGRASS